MKAIIEVDVPDHQIGQEVSIYLKDTMMIKGIVQEPSVTWVTGADGAKIAFKDVPVWKVTKICEILGDVVEAEEEQEPRAGHWIYQKGYIPFKWKCNQCSAEFKTDFNYCPNCGARMESEE